MVLYIESSTVKTRGLEAVAKLTKLETFEGRFNELMDFNTYCKSTQVQGLISYLLVMAPLEAKFDFKTLQLSKITCVFKFRRNEIDSKKVMKLVAGISGVTSLSFDPTAAEMTVTGYVESREILKTLAKRGIEAVLFNHPIPCCLHQKEVVLNGCHIGREDPVALPNNLRCLRIYECHKLRSLSHISFSQQTNELESYFVHGCREMESVLDLESSSSLCTSFQNLELLHLEKLDNLHMLVKVTEIKPCVVSTSSSLIMPGIFSHLKSFRIEVCSNMKQLFPFEVGHGLQNLENLIVANCAKMEEIIASEEECENRNGKGTYSTTTFSFPKLRELKLRNLPAVKRICSSNMVMTCDALQCIELTTCPSLKRMPLSLPLFEDTSYPFEIIKCSRKWFDSVEWDHPNAKNALEPWLQYQ